MLRIFDPHIHLWDLSAGLYPWLEKPSVSFIGSNEPIARSYLLDEFLSEAGDALEIVGAVHVEATASDPLAEVAHLQSVADAAPIPLGIVGHADLRREDLDAVLDDMAEHPAFRGIRHVTNHHSNPDLTYVSEDLWADPAFARGLAALGARKLSFDLALYPGQMAEAACVAQACPETVMVLNQAGAWVDRTLAGWRQWKSGMRALAACDNIFVKLAGFGMWDPEVTASSIRPIILETLDVFGTKRSMFASNFPVDKLFGSYGDLWRSYDAVVADLSESERADLFERNAASVYRSGAPDR